MQRDTHTHTHTQGVGEGQNDASRWQVGAVRQLLPPKHTHLAHGLRVCGAGGEVAVQVEAAKEAAPAVVPVGCVGQAPRHQRLALSVVEVQRARRGSKRRSRSGSGRGCRAQARPVTEPHSPVTNRDVLPCLSRTRATHLVLLPVGILLDNLQQHAPVSTRRLLGDAPGCV
jgi:hypothetical protein